MILAAFAPAAAVGSNDLPLPDWMERMMEDAPPEMQRHMDTPAMERSMRSPAMQQMMSSG